MPASILLADNHLLNREGLRCLLAQQAGINILAEADDGLAALELARICRPELMIIEMLLPGLNGIDTTRQLLAELPDTKVLAMTAHPYRHHVEHIFKAGARGLVLKTRPFTELLEALETVMSGRIYISPEVGGMLVRNMLCDGAKPAPHDMPELTPREREVLQLLAEGNTSKQIAATHHVSVKTVEVHRQRIMQKLDIHNVAQLTRYAIREGLTPL